MTHEERADKYADARLKDLTARLSSLYKEAGKEVDLRIDWYMNGWTEVVTDPDTGKQKDIYHPGVYERYKEQERLFNEGKWTDRFGNVVADPRVFKKWLEAQEGRASHWLAIKQQIAERLTDVNIEASRLINKELPSIYCKSSNAISRIAKESAIEQGIPGVSFEMVDERTIAKLLTSKKSGLPFSYTHVKMGVDVPWNAQKLQNALVQGILQGDSIGHIADRFQQVTNMDRSAAIRNARTAVTAAQSGGKHDRYQELQDKGCEVTKVWVSALDDRTRDEHVEADGQEVDINEPFIVGDEELMFPGDTRLGASGWNIYNCRCTMHTGKIKFTSTLHTRIRGK